MLSFVIYSIQLYQSFQYASAENKLSVAISGLLSGRISFIKITISFAPSILADSVIAAGIPLINVFAIIIFHTENISGYLSGLSSPSGTDSIITLRCAPVSNSAGHTRLPIFSRNSISRSSTPYSLIASAVILASI